MKKIFVSGASGLVGSRFVELYREKFEISAPEYPDLDVSNFDKTRLLIESIGPDVILNFAAFTDVGEAENQRGDETGDCWRVNVHGPENLAKIAKDLEIFFIQISTDMVFPGLADDPGPYAENHRPETDSGRLTWYGFTKAEAERRIAGVLENYAILRIIYPVRAKYSLKLDYVHKPLSLFDQGKLYPLFNDQQISITFIDEACLVLEKIIDGKLTGVFHCASSNTTTPFELIGYLLEKVRGAKNAIQSSSVPDSVRYPKYGGLLVEDSERRLQIKFSTWKEIVNKLIDQGGFW